MSDKLVVLGSGKSGVGAAMLAKTNGYNVFVSDSNKITQRTKKRLKDYKIDFEELKHSIDLMNGAIEVIKSPGISNDVEIIKQLEEKSIPIISEIEFASRYTNAKIVAVTGTNGKTTTTLMIGHILKSSGFDVLVAGNIGRSFAMSLIEKDYDFIILELSSYQLEGIINFKPNISIILNITPDHLDRYDYNFDNYISAKYRIFKNQEKTEKIIYNFDDPNVKNIKTKAEKIPISLLEKNEKGAFYEEEQIIIKLNKKTMIIKQLALQGRHNVFNSMAAAVAARVFEVKDDIIRQSLIDFQNVEHRLEHVLTIHGISFINDSKATNVNACWYAMESISKKIIWITGGVDKGNDYSQLEELVKNKVEIIICLGESKKIKEFFRGKVSTIKSAKNMKEAVELSYNFAKSGDTVLLSPACASFDMYKNFEDRGYEFKKAVRVL